MSYSLFKSEVLAGLKSPHSDKTKAAKVIANAYANLATRMFETLTGGGKFPAVKAGTPALRAGLQTIFTKNFASKSRVNIFNQMAPYIQAFWAGQTALGPTGKVTISYSGKFTGPVIPENSSFEVWLNIFVGCISTHLLTMSGTYTNYYSGATIPWSGALLITFP